MWVTFRIRRKSPLDRYGSSRMKSSLPGLCFDVSNRLPFSSAASGFSGDSSANNHDLGHHQGNQSQPEIQRGISGVRKSLSNALQLCTSHFERSVEPDKWSDPGHFRDTLSTSQDLGRQKSCHPPQTHSPCRVKLLQGTNRSTAKMR
jgi:hypothetical protein